MSEPDLEATFREIGKLVSRTFVLLARALRKWKYWVPAVLAGAVAAFAGPKLIPPIYEAETVLMYRQTLRTESLLGGGRDQERFSDMAARFIDIVMSRTILEQIITAYELYPDVVRREGMSASVDQMRRDLRIRAQGSAMLMVAYKGTDPDKVYAVTERIAELLKKQPGQDSIARAEATQNFLKAQLDILKLDLEAKERALAEFLAQNPEFALDESGGGVRVGTSIRVAGRRSVEGDSNSRLATLTRQADRLRRSLAAETAEPREEPTPQLPRLTPEAQQRISAAERRVTELTAELTSLRTKYTDIHPDVLEARERLAAARAALASERSNASTVRPTPAEPTAPLDAATRAELEARLRGIEQAISAERHQEVKQDSASHDTLNSVIDVETTWISLNRDVATARDQYSAVEQRLFQASTLAKVESSGGQGEIITADPPRKPTQPSARGPRRTAAGAFLFFVALGAVAAFVAALVDDRIFDEYDLESLKLGPIVQRIPALVKARELATEARPASADGPRISA